MKSFITALICAIVIDVVNGNWQDDDAKDIKLLPKVVAINLRGKRTGTGTLINDLTILSANKCLNDSGTKTKDVTIHFPNDTKSYDVESIVPDGDIVIIKLDDNGNPPKCESKVKLSKKLDGTTVEQVKILHTGKKIDKYTLEYFDTQSEENCFFALEEKNLTGKRCGYISLPVTLTKLDLGLTIFADGLLQGVVLTPQIESDPIIYDELSKHEKFLAKYLNNSAKPEKPKKEEKIKGGKKTQGQKSEKEEKKPKGEEKNTKKQKKD